MTAIFAPRAGVAANDEIIVAITPLANSSVNANVSSVSALTMAPVRASLTSGRRFASRPLTEATSPNQCRNPSM